MHSANENIRLARQIQTEVTGNKSVTVKCESKNSYLCEGDEEELIVIVMKPR